MLHDAVLGILTRDQLPAALTLIHRSGLGPQARVIDPERGDISGQLQRAGVIDAPTLSIDASNELVLVVFAGGRMAIATEAMTRFGGRDVQTLARRTSLVLPVSSPATQKRRPARRSSHSTTPQLPVE